MADRTFHDSRLIASLLISVLLACCPLGAQTPDACSALPKVSVPESDRPTIADVRAAGVEVDRVFSRTAPLPGVRPTFVRTGCSAFVLYYSDTPGHVKQARSCVLAQLAQFAKGTDPARAQHVYDLVINSEGFPSKVPEFDQVRLEPTDAMVLAMIYGNGEGVKRNLPLARQFVCKANQPPASPTVIEQLALFNHIVATQGRFDFCKDSGGDFGRGANYVCLGLELEKVRRTVHQQESAITAASAPELKRSFAALQRAWHALDEAKAHKDEIECGGGTGCGGMMEEADIGSMKPWLASLAAVRAGTAQAAGTDAATLAQLDTKLNIAYQQLLTNDGFGGDQSVPTAREAERVWIKYREAWVTYGTQRWPETSADQWRAWQTAEWLRTLTSAN